MEDDSENLVPALATGIVPSYVTDSWKVATGEDASAIARGNQRKRRLTFPVGLLIGVLFTVAQFLFPERVNPLEHIRQSLAYIGGGLVVWIMIWNFITVTMKDPELVDTLAFVLKALGLSLAEFEALDQDAATRKVSDYLTSEAKEVLILEKLHEGLAPEYRREMEALDRAKDWLLSKDIDCYYYLDYVSAREKLERDHEQFVSLGLAEPDIQHYYELAKNF